MLTYKYLMLPLFIVIALMLAGCPMSSLPTKEQESNAGSSSQPSAGSQSQTQTPSIPTSQSSGAATSSSSGTASPSRSATRNRQTESGEGEVHQKKQQDGNIDDVLAEHNTENYEGVDQYANEEKEPDLTDTEQVTNTANNNSQQSTTSSSSSTSIENTDSGQIVDSAATSEQNRKAQDHELLDNKTAKASTADERVSVLDRELAASGGRFDQMILREREYIRDSAKKRGGTTIASNSTAPDSEMLSEGVRSDGGATYSTKSVNTESGKHKNKGVPVQVASYAPPADIPDGSDDDVVARQLREAAMTEPDAALREKLWQEYRKYKGESK